MRIKKIYLSLIALTLFGWVVGTFLILSPQDEAILFLKEGKYIHAETYFESAFSNGDRSTSTLISLKKIGIAKGNIEKAIHFMGQHLHLHPNDVDAHKSLGNLYLNNLQHTKYIETLEKVYHLEPTNTVLKELNRWYLKKNQAVKHFNSLQEIIQKGNAEPDHFLSYAILLANQGEYQNALDLIEQRKKLYPDFLNLKTLLLEISVLNDLESQNPKNSRYNQKILELSKNYIDSTGNIEDLISLLLELRSLGRNDLIHQLIPSIKYLARTDTELETLLIEIQWEDGDKEHAFNQIMRLYRTKALNEKQANLLIQMATEKNDFQTINDFFKTIGLSRISHLSLIELAILAVENRDSAFAHNFEKELESLHLQSHPIESTLLSILQDEAVGEEKLLLLLNTYPLSKEEKIKLFQLASKKGYQQVERGDHDGVKTQYWDLLKKPDYKSFLKAAKCKQ